MPPGAKHKAAPKKEVQPKKQVEPKKQAQPKKVQAPSSSGSRQQTLYEVQKSLKQSELDEAKKVLFII